MLKDLTLLARWCMCSENVSRKVLSIAVWANVFAYNRFFCTAVAEHISEAVTHSTMQSRYGVGRLCINFRSGV